MYEATADVIIQPVGTQQILGLSQQNTTDAARNVDTAVAVLMSQAVKNAAKHQLGHTPNVSVSSNSATSECRERYRPKHEPPSAAADATGYAAAYVAYQRKQSIDDLLQAGQRIQAKLNADRRTAPAPPDRLTRADDGGAAAGLLAATARPSPGCCEPEPGGGAQILANADVPTSPVEPQPVRNVAIVLVLGLLLGIGLVLLREFLDDTITSREDLERAAEGLPVLGQIPLVASGTTEARPDLVTVADSNSPASEAYRTLRTSIQFLGVDRELRSIQFTSAKAEDGKTTTLANIAVAFARAGRRVTIVSCDLRRPRIHEFFRLPNTVGFTSLLLGEASVLDALQPVPGEANLQLLSAGPSPPNPSELLAGSAARELLSSLAEDRRPGARRQPTYPPGQRCLDRERRGGRDADRGECQVVVASINAPRR